MLYLSQMLGRPVVDSTGEKIGTIADLAISTGEVFPRITSLAFLGPGKTPFMISWRKYVESFDEDGITLGVESHNIRFSYLQPDEILLARDLLNRQIVEVRRWRLGSLKTLRCKGARQLLLCLDRQLHDGGDPFRLVAFQTDRAAMGFDDSPSD